MRALSIPFEEVQVPFKEGWSPDQFRAFSPNACVPCLHDGDQVVWDSLAIAEYLAERHTGIWPEDVSARVWARCAACEMHSGFSNLRQRCPMNCGVRVELAETGGGLAKDIARVDELWTQGLSRFGGPYLAGNEFTAADAFFAPVIFRAQSYSLPLGKRATQYFEHMINHELMREWYDAGLREPWRDKDHEDDVLSIGTIQADYRV
jgi:glutathione S-transferase